MSGSVLWVCACVCTLMQDKQEIPWWLGVSYKGIGQYDLQDKLKPRKVSFNVLLHIYPLCIIYFGFVMWWHMLKWEMCERFYLMRKMCTITLLNHFFY